MIEAARHRPAVARGSGALAIVALLAGGGALVYAMGGTQHAWVHALYVPVVVAAWAFGVPGGVAAGVIAGLVAGPAMPLDVASGSMQETVSWAYRLAVFAGVGGISGVLMRSARGRSAALAHGEARFSALVQHAPDLILVQAGDRTVRYASPSVERVLGLTADEIVGRSVGDFVHPADAAALDLEGDAAAGHELRFRHRDGSWRQVELQATDLRDDPSVRGVVLNGRDVTEWRAVEAELRHHATHDALTGLLNRTAFRQALAGQLRERSPALVLLHLDHLRAVTERYGHDEGERVVGAAARRLQELQEPGDVICRHGDVELALLRPDPDDAQDAFGLAERLRTAVGTPFTFGDEPVSLPCSAGVALASDPDGDTADRLLSNAYAALHEARRRGGARTVRYQPPLRANDHVWLRTDAALRRALDQRELCLHYQPIIDLTCRRLAGFEALLRWRHARHGLIPPAEFVPVAERSGAIVPIGAWVLEEACTQVSRWRSDLALPDDLMVSVNVSPRQLEAPELASHVAEALDSSGLAPSRLQLEMTETTLMSDPAESLGRLRELRAIGVGIAIDDFGTGYAALEHLRTLPVDTLKIDQVFVRGLSRDPDGDPIIGAVVGLARSLRLTTVAEGVERPEQADELRALGCDRAQGNLFARPQSLDRLAVGDLRGAELRCLG